ncbi:glycosyltransferase family 2 protein [Cobetia amphilecti]|uniref:glycosyltransferase family 2 protein n=1 Tax=Cobetia amphilecti TaxID=1055104 RepID=UPI0032992C6B
MKITVIILTYNEEIHIQRAISSVADFADNIYVVDSNSSDNTKNIALEMGAVYITNPFVTQAKQFNWALKQLPSNTEWVFRLDADEIVSDELANSIENKIPLLSSQIVGLEVSRRIIFMGRPIKWGGLFPVSTLRLFRYGYGESEDRWMDEHIIVDGEVSHLDGELLDDNLKPLSWWISKHNNYASREAVEILNEDFNFLPDKVVSSKVSGKAGFKRFLKLRVYNKLPIGLRSFLYFIYRFVFRLGFLDGKEGIIFHFLQGFWYRFLVDSKVYEMRKKYKKDSVGIADGIKVFLGVDIYK